MVKVSFLMQVLGGQQLLAVAADGYHRADQGKRRNHGANARAVSEARVHDGRRIVDAAADRADDAVDDHAQVLGILEADVGFDQPSGALDVDVVEAVDQNVADGGVFEKLFERSQAEDLVEDFLGELLPLDHRHRNAFVDDEPLDDIADLVLDAVLVDRLQLIGRSAWRPASDGLHS